MARTVARVKVTIWKSPEWRALPALAQWLYSTVLLTQGDLTLAGKLDFAPKRWAALTGDMDEDVVRHYVEVLERANYIVVDRVTDEVVVRTFTTHDLADGNLNKNLVKGFWTAWDGILSADLRHLVVQALPDRVWEWDGVEVPEEAKHLRTSPRLEPTVSTDGCDEWLESLVATPSPVSAPVSSPAAEPAATEDEKLTAAARLLAAAEIERRGPTTIGNHEGYIRSRLKQLTEQNIDRWRSMLEADPTTTAEQLAAPPVKVSTTKPWVAAEEMTSVAAEARYKLAERVRLGFECQTCRGTKQYLPDDSTVMAPCPCTEN